MTRTPRLALAVPLSLLSLGPIACDLDGTATATGSLGDTEIPAMTSGAAALLQAPDGFATIGVLTTYPFACNTVPDELGLRHEAEASGDSADLAAYHEAELPEDFWEITTMALVADLQELKESNELEVSTSLFTLPGLVVTACHQTARPNIVDGVDENRACFLADGGSVAFNLQAPEEISEARGFEVTLNFEGTTNFIDTAGDDAGELEMKASASGCGPLSQSLADIINDDAG